MLPFWALLKVKIYRVVEMYNLLGAGFIDALKWGGRRSSISHMSFEEEEKMMNGLKLQALEGKVLVAKHIAQ